MAITLGTQFQVDTDGDDKARFAGLTSTTGIALYSSVANGIEARHLTNSGGTITGGTVLSIDGNHADTLCICRLTDTSTLIGYAYGATHRVRILTVSGTTLTANAVTNMTDTGVDFVDCDALTSTKVIYCYMSAAGFGDGTARVLTISGTTITENAAFVYENTFAAAHTAVVAFPDAISAFVFFDSNAEILDISGTTITGNASHFEAGMGTGTTGDNHAAAAVDPGDATQILVAACSGADTGRMQTFFRSGGSLSAPGIPVILNAGGGSATSVSITPVISDKALVSLLDPTSSYIYFAEADISTTGLTDVNTATAIGAGSSSTEIGVLTGSTTAIAVWEDTTEAITVSLPGAALGLAPMTKPASLSADGASIYVALLEGGTPILTKISTTLASDGVTVFNPGGGDNIGVQCSKFNADVVWVAGNFGGTDTVEKSENAGSSFVVKDPGTFNPVTSFVAGPDSDDRVLAFADAGGSVASSSIQETTDSGASWEQKDSGLGFVSRAVERLDVNVEEIVTGNEAGASDNIHYSPNTGQDLEDYSTGLPTQDVTKLIVG